MNIRYFLCLALILSVNISNVMGQETPKIIHYQGNLSNNAGNPINGNQTMIFRIYAVPAIGSILWEETHSAVSVNNGMFSVMLGSINPIDAGIFSSAARYLEIVIGGEVLSPRQSIASVPFAHVSASVNGETNKFPSDGNVTIGTTDQPEPEAKLDIARQGAGRYQRGVRVLNPDLEVEDELIVSVGKEDNLKNIGQLYFKYNGYQSDNNRISLGLHAVNDVLNVMGNGRVGVGTTIPGEKFEVNGTISSTSGGFKFPDGTVQTTAATGSGGGDNLGNHTATQNISLDNHWLSGDGGNEGIYVNNGGRVGIGIANPATHLHINGAPVQSRGQFSITSPPGEDTFLSFYEADNFKAYFWYDDSDDALRLQNVNDFNGGDLSLNPYGGNVQIAQSLRIEPQEESPNIIGGYEGNYVVAGVKGATINGGGLEGKPNFVTDDYGTIGGGSENYAGDNEGTTSYRTHATVGGGNHNFAKGSGSTIGGGVWNEATGSNNTIAGGSANKATGFMWATIGGGTSNDASGSYSTIVGGHANTSGGNGSVVCGGHYNTAAGDNTFAAGRGAKANHNGCFVWADDSAKPGTKYIESTAANQFIIRAAGGAQIYSNAAHTSGVKVNPGASAWSTISDRAMKENFRKVDAKHILENLSRIPITRWNYKAQDAQIQHIGPMAQDFYNTFGLGEDNKHISTIDTDGVALAAIQGLYELVQKQAEQIEKLQEQVRALQNR